MKFSRQHASCLLLCAIHHHIYIFMHTLIRLLFRVLRCMRKHKLRTEINSKATKTWANGHRPRNFFENFPIHKRVGKLLFERNEWYDRKLAGSSLSRKEFFLLSMHYVWFIREKKKCTSHAHSHSNTSSWMEQVKARAYASISSKYLWLDGHHRCPLLPGYESSKRRLLLLQETSSSSKH